MDDINPLNDQHLADINNALKQAGVARKRIAMAKSAGIDVSDHEAELDRAEAQLRKVKQVYFPGR